VPASVETDKVGDGEVQHLREGEAQLYGLCEGGGVTGGVECRVCRGRERCFNGI
jgi:hypothetical protein